MSFIVIGYCIQSIYGRIFEWLVTKLNKATEAAAPASGAEHKSIGLLDIFGFENVQNNRFFNHS